jgi:hypothetical protein
MGGNRLSRERHQPGRIVLPHRPRLFDRQLCRHISLQWIREGLVGDDVGNNPAPGQFRQHDRRIGA